MEEKKSLTGTSDSSHSDKRGDNDIEARFAEFCKSGICVGEATCKEAVEIFKGTKHLLLANPSAIGNGTLEEAERYWFAFVLFSLQKLSKRNRDNVQQKSGDIGLNFCQILRVAKLNIVDFFKELPQYVVKSGPILSKMYGPDWESQLEVKELQVNFEHLSILSGYTLFNIVSDYIFDLLYHGFMAEIRISYNDRRYKRSFRELFLTIDPNGHQESAVSGNTTFISDCQRFGWLLFLALRVHAIGRFKDLVTCIHGLVSVLAILMIHVPSRFRNSKLSDEQFVKKGDKGVDLLASLCNQYDISEDELKKMMEKTNHLIADTLKKKPRSASECKNEKLENINTDGLIYYDALLEEASLQSDLDILQRDYEDAISFNGELDERIFMNEEDSLLGSGGISGGAINATGNKRKFDLISSPTKTISSPYSPMKKISSPFSPTKTISSPLSPFRSPASRENGILGGLYSKMAATPVTTAMTTSKWLRTFISPLPSKPSSNLQRFLASCDRDVTNDVIRRAQIILEAIFPCSALGEQNTNLMENIWAEQRRLEALKLYYRVLEAMCTAEAQVLHANNLTSLLTNERFHRCMLSCSAELVLATHKTVTMLFPAVLDRTGITAFDLSKVIESFIRHEESLPRELRRHLNSLEERLLETMVWEKGSSIYNSLTVARPSLSSEINHLGLLAEPMPSLDAIAMRINFSSGSLPPLPSVKKHDLSPGKNEDIRSPKRPCPDNRSVLVERNSFASPVKDRLLALSHLKSKLSPPPLQSAFASPNRPRPGGGGETCAETAINIFFGKISKLAAVRINGMVERLPQYQHHIRDNVYRLFQQILIQRTSLFFNRHIDQIILCCFYGVAKISKVNLTFKEIIFNYRKQPQSKPQVFRSVFVDWSSARQNGRTGVDHIDIITFYNEIFIPAAKPLVVEVASGGSVPTSPQVPEVNNNKESLGQSPLSPKVSPFPSLPDMSPKKVSVSHNVYVSPLRTSKMDALISNGSKSYYACVGESTHAYQSPSKDLTAINNRLNSNKSARGSLKFEDMEVDVGLVSDSMVANTLNLQNGTPVKQEKPDI